MKSFTPLNKLAILIVFVLFTSNQVLAQLTPPSFEDNTQDVPLGSGIIALGLIMGAFYGVKKLK
jgi:ABC-type arginine transport system permease subunit